MTTPDQDPIRYPALGREVGVGDIIQECECGCVLVYEREWHLVPCDEHQWKVR